MMQRAIEIEGQDRLGGGWRGKWFHQKSEILPFGDGGHGGAAKFNRIRKLAIAKWLWNAGKIARGFFCFFKLTLSGRFASLPADETQSQQANSDCSHFRTIIMKMHHSSRVFCGILSCLATALLAANSSEAGSRRFGYSYETTTMAKGAMELETGVTWKTQQESDPGLESFDIRHEFEYGVTDRLQLALYFADWNYEKSSGHGGKADFSDVAVEAIYNLTDPNTTAFGSAVYGEVKGGDGFVELEAKLLLQKNLGSWMLVYNVGGEIVWENDYADDEAELAQTLGVSYQISPSWSVGLEALHEIAVPDVESIGDSGVFVGPNASWRNDRFAATVTGLWQATSLADEPDFQLRTIFSIEF